MLIGVIFAVFGVLGGVMPARLLAFLYGRRVGLFPIAVAGRVLIGVLLVLAAPYCRLPALVLVIGVAALAAAVVLLLLGRSRFERFIERWLERPPGLLRLFSVVAIALGGLLVWAGGCPS